MQVRSQAGVQYDRSQWRFGAAIRTPGLTVHRTGAVTLDGLIDGGAMSAGASVFDPDADLDYQLPWEFQGGAAWVRDRIELELDLQAYSSIDAYPMLATAQPVVIYGETGANQPPSVATRPFPGLTSASDGVVNVAAADICACWRTATFACMPESAATTRPWPSRTWCSTRSTS